MFRKSGLLFGGAALAVFAATGAAANMQGSFFVPELPVANLSQTEFEVLEGRSEGARTYWCAAAFHARFTLGRDSGTLFLSRGFGPSQTEQGARAVAFSLTPTPQVVTAVSLSITQEGANLPINHAIQFCRDSDLEADN